MNVVFRTDASAKIGSGHVIRCLTLASVLKQEGSNVFFISRNHKGNLSDLIKRQGFDVYMLPADPEGASISDFADTSTNIVVVPAKSTIFHRLSLGKNYAIMGRTINGY